METFTRVGSLPRIHKPVYPIPFPASEVTVKEGVNLKRKGRSTPVLIFSISMGFRFVKANGASLSADHTSRILTGFKTKVGTVVVSFFSCANTLDVTKSATLIKTIFLNMYFTLCARQGLWCTLFIFSLAALPAQVPLVLKQEGSNLSHFFSNGTPMRTAQI